MNSTTGGLVIIIIAWIVQIIYSWRGKRDIHSLFLFLYMLGAFVLIIDAYNSDILDVAVLQLLSLLLAVVVLARVGIPVKERVIKPKKKR